MIVKHRKQLALLAPLAPTSLCAGCKKCKKCKVKSENDNHCVRARWNHEFPRYETNRKVTAYEQKAPRYVYNALRFAQKSLRYGKIVAGFARKPPRNFVPRAPEHCSRAAGTLLQGRRNVCPRPWDKRGILCLFKNSFRPSALLAEVEFRNRFLPWTSFTAHTSLKKLRVGRAVRCVPLPFSFVACYASCSAISPRRRTFRRRG